METITCIFAPWHIKNAERKKTFAVIKKKENNCSLGVLSGVPYVLILKMFVIQSYALFTVLALNIKESSFLFHLCCTAHWLNFAGCTVVKWKTVKWNSERYGRKVIYFSIHHRFVFILQVLLLRWMLVVYDFMDGYDKMHCLYGILFYFLDSQAMVSMAHCLYGILFYFLDSQAMVSMAHCLYGILFYFLDSQAMVSMAHCLYGILFYFLDSQAMVSGLRVSFILYLS